MKKVLCLLLIISVILTGCGKSEEKKNDEVLSTDVETTEAVSDDTQVTTEPTTEKKEETTKKTTTKKTTKKTTAKTTSCSKVFAHKYSVVTKDEATCNKEGNLKFMELSDKGENVFAYECEKITDKCGDVYYGAYFWSYDDAKSTEVKVYR